MTTPRGQSQRASVAPRSPEQFELAGRNDAAVLPGQPAEVRALEDDLELIEPEYRPMPPKRWCEVAVQVESVERGRPMPYSLVDFEDEED